MRAVVQRVSRASVRVDDELVASVGRGLLVYLGAGSKDDESDVAYTAEKIARLRIFEDDDGKMNRSVLDVAGEVLLVSQFTLYGDTRKGRRPSFNRAAAPDEGRALYEAVERRIRSCGLSVETGRYGAFMIVEAAVSGPVTILIDSNKEF